MKTLKDMTVTDGKLTNVFSDDSRVRNKKLTLEENRLGQNRLESQFL